MAMALSLSLKLVLPPISSIRCPYQVPNMTPRSKKKTPNMEVQGPRMDDSPTVTKLKLTGALPEYLWAEPRQRVKEFSPEDRRASVESVLTFGTFLSALDGIRFKLESSDFNTIHRRFGELKKSQEVGLVKEQRKTMLIIMKKPCPQLKWPPALRAFRGLVRCALNTSLRRQVLVRCASNASSTSAQFISDTEIERTSCFEQKVKFVDEWELCLLLSLGPIMTGLPMVVYISPKYADHGPRIKISQSYGSRHTVGRWFYYTIEENPRMIGDAGDIHVQDLELVCEFIQQNREALIWYWDKGFDDFFGCSDVVTRLKIV